MQTDCNVIKYGTKTICHVNAREFNFNGQSPDIVIVSNNTPIRLKTNQKTLHIIIADCSNSYKFVKQLKKTCVRFGIPFYWTKENSAIKLSL